MDGLRALHHHLAHSGFTRLEAVSQWPGGVRGYKTLQCDSPSLEPEFGFFKLQVRIVIVKASRVFTLDLDASPHTTALCQALAILCPRSDTIPSAWACLHAQTHFGELWAKEMQWQGLQGSYLGSPFPQGKQGAGGQTLVCKWSPQPSSAELGLFWCLTVHLS